MDDASVGDLVLGYATGYGVTQIEAFTRSLRAFHDGPAALFVDDAADVRAFLADHAVEALTPAPAGAWSPQPVVSRFADYARALTDRSGVRDVLLTDVRDVVFQAPPFEPRARALEVFIEYEAHTLGDHAFQMKHLRGAVGDRLADGVKEERCICAGTILGPAADVARLCRIILMLGAIPRAAIGGGFGSDQASLAAAIRYGLIEAEVQDNYRRVATLGLSLEGISTRGGDIVNPDGGVSPIVHQYDRHAALMDVVRARWNSDIPDRIRTGPQGLQRLVSKFRASSDRRIPDFR